MEEYGQPPKTSMKKVSMKPKIPLLGILLEGGMLKYLVTVWSPRQITLKSGSIIQENTIGLEIGPWAHLAIIKDAK